MSQDIPHLDRGSFRIRGSDTPPVHYEIRLVGEHFEGRIWTNDGKLDKIVRAPDATPKLFEQIDQILADLATAWLLEDR